MLKLLEVTQIVSGKNIRNERDNEIAELADSIERQGLINPILVYKRDDGKYEVIAGHRRFEAVKRLGLPHIECNVFEDMSERDVIFAQIAENVQHCCNVWKVGYLGNESVSGCRASGCSVWQKDSKERAEKDCRTD